MKPSHDKSYKGAKINEIFTKYLGKPKITNKFERNLRIYGSNNKPYLRFILNCLKKYGTDFFKPLK